MKKAFTMLELVFAIIVIGILAAAIIPRVGSSVVQERAIQLVSHIRYTQHLAMVDDKFNINTADWYSNRWQLVFNANQYSIVSNDGTRFAENPDNSGDDFQNITLDGVTVALSGGCNGQTIISFDHLGRVMVGDLSDDTASYITGQLMTTTCVITITDDSTTSTINIEPETGYAHII